MLPKGFPGGSAVRNPSANAGDSGLIPESRRFPRRREWQPTPVFLTGKLREKKRMAGYSPWGHRVRHDLATKKQQQQKLPKHSKPAGFLKIIL